MSTKTIKQRIALVAVSAVAAGFLSVISTPAANAVALTGVGVSTGQLAVETAASIDGDASTSGGYPTDSIGWIADTSSTAASTSASGVYTSGGLAKTGSILANAKLAISATGSSSANVSIIVTGGTLSAITANTTAGTLALNGSATAVTLETTDNIALAAVFSVSAAAGSTATITAYSGTSVTSTAPTNGSLLGSWTLTVASASVSGVMAVGSSYVVQQACIDKGATAVADITGYDTSSKCQNGKVAVIYTAFYDALDVSVSGGKLAASATGGTVNVVAEAGGVEDTIAAADSYAATTAFDTIDASAENFILVTQPTANAAGSSTVTITYNGAVVATKTVSWVGDVATLTIDPANTHTAFANGKVDTDAGFRANIAYAAKDAAGNVVNLSSQPSITGATGAIVEATISTTDNVLSAAVQTTARGYGYSTLLIPSNAALYGAGSFKIKLTNAAGATITSNEIKATVSNGATASFTASWDKASYVPGEIATLTITVKDAYGNLMGTGTTLTGLDNNLITNSSGFDAVGGTCGDSSTVTAGVKTCKFSADNAEGAYAWSVDLTTSPVNQSAVTGSAVVKASTATVSNADVLKSIVALIASINKQIQALQKLILKR